MKRLLVPLCIVAFALTGWAQKSTNPTNLDLFDPVDTETESMVKTFLKQFETVYNFHQAEILPTFYADDAVWITPEGQFKGPTAIVKQMVNFHFKHWHAHDEVITVSYGVDQ